MLSQTGLYALQALLHLAEQGNGVQVPASAMAKGLKLPGTYLAKVLQRLAREGILESTRGAGGGYRLAVDPARLTVADAIAPFQELRTAETCLLGGPCDLENPCSAHARRTAWNAAALEILERTTLADLLSGAPMGALGSVVTTSPEETR
jgi:Rrf2 family iron-sulfur cluster assembly transcriptional regulator